VFLSMFTFHNARRFMESLLITEFGDSKMHIGGKLCPIVPIELSSYSFATFCFCRLCSRLHTLPVCGPCGALRPRRCNQL
jgi:hypothetical protein